MQFSQQKLTANWIQFGDTNSSFFYNQIRSRIQQNRVYVIQDMHGNHHKGPVNVGQAFVGYYQQMIGSISKASGAVHPIIAAIEP